MIAAEASAEMNVDLDNAKLIRVPDHFIPMYCFGAEKNWVRWSAGSVRKHGNLGEDV